MTMLIDDIIKDKARKDAGYAVAYALLELTGQVAKLRGSLGALGESLRTDHPLMGETFAGLAEALGRIGEALDARKA